MPQPIIPYSSLSIPSGLPRLPLVFPRVSLAFPWYSKYRILKSGKSKYGKSKSGKPTSGKSDTKKNCRDCSSSGSKPKIEIEKCLVVMDPNFLS